LGAGRGEDDIEPHPAVSLVYSIDGRAALNAVNEYRSSDISTDGKRVNCTIGGSSFKVESADYGTGYVLKVELVTARKRRVKAEFEWLSIEADLLTPAAEAERAAVGWNIVSPRSDVSGRITTYAQTGEVKEVLHFRGTGCHDHLRSAGCLDEIFDARCWGRAHFVDSTAVFQSIRTHDGAVAGKVLLITDGSLCETEAGFDANGFVLSRFGIRVPREMVFYTDTARLEIRPVSSIDSGFCEVKMLSKMRLMCEGQKPHEGEGIVSIMSPGRLRRRLIRRLSGLRIIGAGGHPPLF
jgi:hypothetical protein